MITIRYDLQQIGNAILKRQTACMMWQEQRERIRRFYRDRGHELIHLWVIETRNGLNVHCIVNMPRSRRFRREFAVFLCDMGKVCIPPWSSPIDELRKFHSGHLVHMSRISASKIFRRTGSLGAIGAAEYMGKTLNKVIPTYRPHGLRPSTVGLTRGPAPALRIGKRRGCCSQLSRLSGGRA